LNWNRKRKQKKKIPRSKNNIIASIEGERKTYLAINAIFAGIIILVFIYSGFFNPEKSEYPLRCIHEQVTGEPCPSCGLSRSFSSIIRGNLDQALMYNEYGMRIFLFFLLQLVMRISNIVFILRKPLLIRNLIIADSVIAVITFLLAFGQFFTYYIRILF